MRTRHRKKTLSNQDNAIHGRLVPHYTFDNFVVGDCNRLAHAAALAMANNQAESYTPLFIHGGCGLGKTHLLHAIGNCILQKAPQNRICSCSSETFMSEMIDSIRSKKLALFRNRYHNADILLFDGLQFAAGRKATQEELWQAFDALFLAGKRIVIASDRPPKKLAHFDGYLLSRFEGSLVVEIQPPDVETRLNILKIKAEHLNITVPDDIMQFLAASDFGNVRAIEGMLIKLGAYSNLARVPISMDLAREVVEEWSIQAA